MAPPQNPYKRANPYNKKTSIVNNKAPKLIDDQCDEEVFVVSTSKPSVPSKSNVNNDVIVIDDGPVPSRTVISSTTITASTLSSTSSSKFPVPQNNSRESELLQTLTKYYGYSSFRPGQLDILQSVIHEKRDACVFWATGQGKSICFQLPALHLKQVVVVVSPLISLMQDQCTKLNTLSRACGEGDVATYLGSGQFDSSVEYRAMQGEFLLVYLTPEKIKSAGFLDRLAALNAKKGIALFGIDEAHCVSQWGHDFRPEFMQLGDIRRHCGLSSVPVLSLTATAVPRVRDDISRALLLKLPNISIRSFDRSNLKISVYPKPSGGFASAFSPLVKELKREIKYSASNGTIIYARTRSQVDSITEWIGRQIGTNNVAPYHAGMSSAQREDAHTGFLVGRVPVIVATVAFGMGIDKPDTRRVYHWGPPKTFEEYYQQIGRAGRDGLDSECTMWANSIDFASYQDDFYLGNLGGEAKEATLKSLNALKTFALASKGCRRYNILQFLGETPPFGSKCGTCDLCLRYKSGDSNVNFIKEAQVLLTAIKSLKPSCASSTHILKVVIGNTTEEFRYNNGVTPRIVAESINQVRKELPRKYVQGFYKELIPILVEAGYVRENVKKSSQSGSYSNTYNVYSLTTMAYSVLNGDVEELQLPKPQMYRDMVEKEKKARDALLQRLQSTGVDISKIPKEELEAGDGTVIKAHTVWMNFLNMLDRKENKERLERVKELHQSIVEWRQANAEKYRLAPATVLSEYLLDSISYVGATSKSSITLESLKAVGARTAVESLCEVICQWQVKYSNSTVSDERAPSRGMIFPAKYAPPKPWDLYVHKVIKKTGLTNWESSYKRFEAGEHVQAIAINPVNGRPIQEATVLSHIMKALVAGQSVSILRLAQTMSELSLPPPNSEEWEQLCHCEVNSNTDVTKTDDKDLLLKDLLEPIIGDIGHKLFDDRTAEEARLYTKWVNLMRNWFLPLRRCGFVPTFEKTSGISSVDSRVVIVD